MAEMILLVCLKLAGILSLYAMIKRDSDLRLALLRSSDQQKHLLIIGS